MIELGAKLHISVDGTATKHEAVLVGIRNDEYMIVKMPEKVFYIGHKLVVRYIHKGRIYAFKAEVLANIFEPDLLVFIKIPKEIMDKNLRSHSRSSCSLPVYVEVGIHMLQAVVSDISPKGAMIIVDKVVSKIKEGRLRAGDEMQVSIQFAGSETIHNVDAAIRNVGTEKHVYRIGVEFVNMKPKTEETLNNYLQVVSVLEKTEYVG